VPGAVLDSCALPDDHAAGAKRQEPLGAADSLDMLSAGALSAGALAAGARLAGLVVAAGVLHAATAPPMEPASIKASKMRLIIWESSVAWQG
jgi:transketolase C-terminal domain/subunit